MKKLHLVIILVITWSMFTQCSAVKRSITPAHYKTIEKQTVLIESVTVVTPDKCKNDSKEKDGDEVCQNLIRELPPIRGASVGTGTFIKVGKKIVVLTAEHVCSPDAVPDEVKTDAGITIFTKVEHTINVNSRFFSGKGTILKRNAHLDLCLLSLDSQPNVLVAKIAQSAPERGSKIHYAGAPFGSMSMDMLMLFEGRHAGSRDKFLVFAMPCEQGTSGSGVRNSENQIFSIVQRVNGNFKHMCYGVRADLLREFLGLE